MNVNPRNNIPISENTGQMKQKKSFFSFLCPIFPDMRMLFFGLTFILDVLRLSGSSELTFPSGRAFLKVVLN